MPQNTIDPRILMIPKTIRENIGAPFNEERFAWDLESELPVLQNGETELTFMYCVVTGHPE